MDEKWTKPTSVANVVQRGSEVTSLMTKDAKKQSLMSIVEAKVLPKTMVYTDKLKSYDDLGEKGYEHELIPHAEKVYVVGNVHTNTIEEFWRLLKRGIGSVYHSMSERHLQRYLNEYAFRYNHRNERALFGTVEERARMIWAGQRGKYDPIG